MVHFVDLSHPIHDGLITYPALAAPRIRPEMSFDDSRLRYEEPYEFRIDRIDMIGNTGTYIDTPAHRFRDGADLSDLDLARVAALEVAVIRSDETTIPPEALGTRQVTDKAVLFNTGWSRHWTTPAYGIGHPHLSVEIAGRLVDGGATLVGIDSLNVDATADGTRPIHTVLLEAGIPILEHLTNLDRIPETGAVLYAVPPKVRGMGSFPVRAFALVE